MDAVTNSLRGFRALSVVVFAGAFLMTPMPAKAQPSSHVPYVPPGNADSLAPVQAIWTQVWSYKGLATTVELLKAIHHPRYKEFEKVQAKFKAAFGEAYEKKIAERPTWNDPAGKMHPLLPDFLYAPPERHIFDDAFLLDTGSLSLPWAGLFDADDPRMKSFAGPLENQAFWVTVDVPAKTAPGTYEIPFDLLFINDNTSATMTATVNVHEFTINKRKNFPVTHWWRPSGIYEYYHLKPWGDEWFAMTKKYIRDMVEHGSNVVLVNTLEIRREVFKVPNQMLTITKTGDKFNFDYSVVRRFVHMARDEGMEYFEWPHLWIYWGVKNPMVVYKKSGDKYTLFFPLDSDGFSPEYIDFLKQYLDSLHGFLKEEGILEKSFFHLSDEPGGGEQYERYKKARGILKKIAPWMKVMDALSHLEYGKNGVTDIPVPSIVTAKSFTEAKIPHWAYFCCNPKGDYLNRFMDTPLAKVRMSGMLFYRLGAQGFLHWGYNYWFKLEKDQLLDVYEHGDAEAWPSIPYGDPFVVYPGKDGPVSSTRWEIFAESLQDYAMLQTAGIDPDDPMLREIVDYNKFPKSESWILDTVEKIMERKQQSGRGGEDAKPANGN